MIDPETFYGWFSAISEKHRMQFSDPTIDLYYKRLSFKLSTLGFERASEVLFDSGRSMPTVDDWVATWADICRNEGRVDVPVVTVEVEKWGVAGEIEVVQVGALPLDPKSSPCPEAVKRMVAETIACSPVRTSGGLATIGSAIASSALPSSVPSLETIVSQRRLWLRDQVLRQEAIDWAEATPGVQIVRDAAGRAVDFQLLSDLGQNQAEAIRQPSAKACQD